MVRILLIGLFCLQLSACAAGGEREGGSGLERVSETLMHDGIDRQYVVRSPKSVRPGESRPLVLVLHGGGGTGGRMDRFSRFGEVAAREGILMVLPSGLGRHWNDGRGVGRYRAMRDQVDDVGFLVALIARVQETYLVDPERIYVTGASNGGMMTLRLVCERPEIFAAAAPVIASMPENLAGTCQPRPPVPLLMINGRNDELVPWEGPAVRFGSRELGRILPVPETFRLWGRFNGCGPRQQTVLWPNHNAEDETRVREHRYAGCEAETVLLEIEGGGHTWPGGRQYLPKFLVGRVSREFDAAEYIWEFFSRHRREPEDAGHALERSPALGQSVPRHREPGA